MKAVMRISPRLAPVLLLTFLVVLAGCGADSIVGTWHGKMYLGNRAGDIQYASVKREWEKSYLQLNEDKTFVLSIGSQGTIEGTWEEKDPQLILHPDPKKSPGGQAGGTLMIEISPNHSVLTQPTPDRTVKAEFLR